MYKYAPLPEEMVKQSKAMNETNDCTVKAFAISLGTSYDKAHRHLQNFCERKRRKGIISREMIPNSLTNTKFSIGPYSKSNRITLSEFCRRHPVGRFYVVVARHAIAVIDGVVYDHSDRPRRRVEWALRIHK